MQAANKRIAVSQRTFKGVTSLEFTEVTAVLDADLHVVAWTPVFGGYRLRIPPNAWPELAKIANAALGQKVL